MILRTTTLQRQLIAAQDKVIAVQEAQVECYKELADCADRHREVVESENGMLKDLCKLERGIDIPEIP